MRGVKDLSGIRNVRIQFFRDFPLQRGFLRFPFVNLAAGKLPLTGEVCALESSSDEKSALTLDDRRDDDDSLRHVSRSRDYADRPRTAVPLDTSSTSAFEPCRGSLRSPSAPD